MNNINPPYITNELIKVLVPLGGNASLLYLYLVNRCYGLTSDYEGSLSTMGDELGLGVSTVRRSLRALKSVRLITEKTQSGSNSRYSINPLQLAIEGMGESVHSPTPPLSQTVTTPQTVATPQTVTTSKSLVKQIDEESDMSNDELLPTNEPLDSYPVCDSCGYTPPIGATQGLIDMVRSELNRYGVCQSCYSNQRKEARYKTKSPIPTH